MKKYFAAIFVVLLLSLVGCQEKDSVITDDTSSTDCVHSWGEWTVASPPTCKSDGVNSRSCSNCLKTETTSVTALKHDDTEMTWVITKEADCTNEGIKDYVCPCGIASNTEILPALGHTPVADEAIAATCHSVGLTEGSHCSVCNVVITAQQEVEKTDHTPVIDGAVAATCHSVGLTEGSHCSVCNVVITAQQEVEKTDHTPVIDGAIAATCKSTGLTEGSHCSVCNAVITVQQEVKKTDHALVIDGAVAATCQSTGLTQGSHCSVCGSVITPQKVTNKTGHIIVKDNAVPATCKYTGLTEGSHCSVCKTVLVKQEIVPANNDHNMAKKLVTTNGIDPEYTLHFCAFCSYSYKENSENFDFSDYSVDNLKFTLTDADLTKVQKASQECLRLYRTKDISNAGKLVTAMHETKLYRDNIMRQWSIADLLSSYNLSDTKMQENYSYASTLYSKAVAYDWSLFNEAWNDTNPLSQTVIDYYYSNYDIVTSAAYDVSAYESKLDSIEREFLTFYSTGTAEDVHEMYTEYLAVSRKIAKGYRFSNYYEYLSERMYSRDYGSKEREVFREYVRDYLVPLYKELKNKSDRMDSSLTQAEYELSVAYDNAPYNSFGENLLYTYINSLPSEAASIMKTPFEKKRILIGDQPDSYDHAWVTFIGTVPYCYFHKDRTDLTTVVHELGHYYANSVIDTNANVSYDIKEVYSQTNQLLMFRHLQKKMKDPAFDAFVAYKLSEMVYQAIFSAIRDEFTEIMMSNPKSSDFSIDEINQIMEDLLKKYGADDISTRFTELQMTYWHRLGLYQPGYDISYAVSFVVAYQIYCNSESDYAAAVQQYIKVVNEMDPESTFIGTVTGAGLYSPFDKRAYSNF